ncbi:hypothetical protein AB6T38_07015 [Aliiglaciecola sp. SL4]|uniref:hypothetical protein n=1 Tax=Aliiglaciecola sp. SL4 TaxID=3239806 RepID=UPI00355BE500
MTDAFEIARKALSIKNVLLRDSYVALDEEFDTKELESINAKIQTFRGVQKVKEVSLQKDDNEIWEYHFFYACGIRLMEESDSDIDNDDSKKIVAPLVEIKATFLAKYNSTIKLEKDSVEAFSEENVGYHVWPYWRELVQSSCLRMDITPLETPMYYCNSVD